MAVETDADGRTLRLGGALVMVDGLGHFATLLVHGNLPNDTKVMAMDHIADRSEWPALKLLRITFVLQRIGTLAALTESRTFGRARFSGRMSLAFLFVGATAFASGQGSAKHLIRCKGSGAFLGHPHSPWR